jgi:threonine 3-dehydrogenase
MFRTWELMQRLMDGGKLDPAPLITHRFSLDEYERAFETRAASDRPVGKVLLYP